MNIEITIPVLDEQDTLEKQIKRIDEYLEYNFAGEKISIIIADNGSIDRTESIANQLSCEIQRISYIKIDKKGVGRALKRSWSMSQANIVGYMDLDLATDLSYLKPALSALIEDKADVVTGSRLAKEAIVNGRKTIRKIASTILNLILRIVFLSKFTDGMCGFKFLKRSHVERLINNGATSDGWFFATELLVVAEHLGMKVYDLPVKWTDDPNSKVKIINLSLEYLKSIALLKKKLNDPRAKYE